MKGTGSKKRTVRVLERPRQGLPLYKIGGGVKKKGGQKNVVSQGGGEHSRKRTKDGVTVLVHRELVFLGRKYVARMGKHGKEIKSIELQTKACDKKTEGTGASVVETGKKHRIGRRTQRFLGKKGKQNFGGLSKGPRATTQGTKGRTNATNGTHNRGGVTLKGGAGNTYAKTPEKRLRV